MILFCCCCSLLWDINPAQVLLIFLALSTISKYMNTPLSQTDTDRRSEARETMLVETERTVDPTSEIAVWLGVSVCIVLC